MPTVKVKRMELNNYKCFNENPEVFEFGETTRISGKNGSGKSTIKNAFLDVMTGKNADGSQCDNVRPIVDGSEKMDVPVVREVTLDIDGIETTIRKTTKQKRERRDGEMISVPGSNVNGYEVDNISYTQKKFDEFVAEKICKPERLIACCNPNVFLAKLNKSTADGRSFLEDLCGFSLEQFIKEHKEEFGEVRDIAKGHKIEDVQKTLNRERNEQKKKIEKQIATIEYEKSKPVQAVDVSGLTSRKEELMCVVSDLDEQEKSLDEAVSSFDKVSREIVSLKAEAEAVRGAANVDLVNKRQSVKSEITGLRSDKRDKENNLRLAEMDLKHANMAVDRHTAEVKRAQEDWKVCSMSEFDESEMRRIEDERFDEDSQYCPTCGQILPLDERQKKRDLFEVSKEKRLRNEQKKKLDFEENRDIRLTEITESGNKAAADLKEAKKAQEEAEKKISEIKEKITSLAMEIQKKEKELSEIPESVDMSDNAEYQSLMGCIAEKQSELEKMDNGSVKREEIRTKRNELIRTSAKIDAEINNAEHAKRQHEEQIEQLESHEKEMQMVLVEIERKISVLKNFSIKKNQAISELVNPHFKEFQFVFTDETQSGEIIETLRMVSDGIEYASLNHSKQLVAQADLCKGLQDICGINMCIWLDDSESINDVNFPDLGRQTVILKVTDDDLRVEAVK